jgi:hypothetical protein
MTTRKPFCGVGALRLPVDSECPIRHEAVGQDSADAALVIGGLGEQNAPHVGHVGHVGQVEGDDVADLHAEPSHLVGDLLRIVRGFGIGEDLVGGLSEHSARIIVGDCLQIQERVRCRCDSHRTDYRLRAEVTFVLQPRPCDLRQRGWTDQKLQMKAVVHGARIRDQMIEESS